MEVILFLPIVVLSLHKEDFTSCRKSYVLAYLPSCLDYRWDGSQHYTSADSAAHLLRVYLCGNARSAWDL